MNVALLPPEDIQTDEWYTPLWLLRLARQALGGIDLDPASCFKANVTVKATTYFTKVDNGLKRQWQGNVWLNPPFARDLTQPNNKRSVIEKWIRKCQSEYLVGRVQQAIILTTIRTDTPWFEILWLYPVCFLRVPVQFSVPYKTKTWNGKVSHMHGTCLTYLGTDTKKFITTFKPYGRIVLPEQVL